MDVRKLRRNALRWLGRDVEGRRRREMREAAEAARLEFFLEMVPQVVFQEVVERLVAETVEVEDGHREMQRGDEEWRRELRAEMDKQRS